MRLKADGNGNVAVYNEVSAGGDGPFTSPLSYIPHLKFHSALGAIGRTATSTGTLSIPSRIANFSDTVNHQLFAHGVSGGIPYVEGRITALNGSGVNIPLAGSVPIQHDTTWGHVQWVHLGADSTYVRLVEQYSTEKFTAFPAITVSFEVWTTDLVL